MKLYFVLLMKSHLQSYPSPLQINSFWNLGFLLGITIILQIITGIFLGLHYTSDINSQFPIHQPWPGEIRVIHGCMTASWKICSLAINRQSFLVIDGYLLNFF